MAWLESRPLGSRRDSASLAPCSRTDVTVVTVPAIGACRWRDGWTVGW